ncbi:glycoside hydrolase family 54 protein [Mycena pura]|uniref:Alpha-L-arabinofuranosidase n=1 Tax=Mycena pura TaxID=153505 RepID=A0AAD6VKV0_9AGAR|nr:glycoside hydrolase family 54 protein [Mycena pura]
MLRFCSLLVLCLIATLGAAGPCDIYASGGTPCVAAHSTTRALFSAYSGSLYQIIRGSDGATTNIGPLSAGGVANAAAQDSFCASTTCLITTIFDQSGHGNHLTHAPPGGADSGTDPNGFDNMAAADGAPVTLNGQRAYGVFISPGTGYRNDATNSIAVGDAAQGMYAVFDGTHFNGDCCFDYGNAETSADDTGNGHMEAIYFGTAGPGGAGSGPWIMADLENGLFAQGSTAANPSDPTMNSRFVTAVVKGEPGNWAIRGGNAASGSLSTFFSGARPSGGYNPMHKEGAIILGIGGDNSNRAQGTFYEGVVTSGFPADATENSVQSNVVAAGYAAASFVSGPAVSVGSTVSLRATTACCTTRFIAHTGATVNTQVVTASDTSALKLSASWNVVAGLGNSACVSFESRDTPGSFIRHSGFELFVNANDGSQLFHEDATWCPRAGINGEGNSLRSWSYPAHYFRHFNAILYAASNGGADFFDATALFNNDTTWVVGPAFA